MDKVDLEIRNISIATAWTIMGEMTDMKYREKIEWLMKEYYLSNKSVEAIISQYYDGKDTNERKD